MKEHSTINYPKKFESTVLIRFGRHVFKNSKFYKECMNSLVVLPPRTFTVIESQRTKYFTNYHVSQAFTNVLVSLCLAWCHLCGKSYVNKEKGKRWRQYRFSYLKKEYFFFYGCCSCVINEWKALFSQTKVMASWRYKLKQKDYSYFQSPL